MALKKIGDGDRVRKPKYGKDTRGGETRRREVTKQVRRPTNDTPSPDDDQFPEPGGHPTALKQAAGTLTGRESPRDNPFAKLKEIEQKRQAGKPEAAKGEPVVKKRADENFLDEMFSKTEEVQRPTRALEDEERLIEQGRRRLPILRTEKARQEAIVLAHEGAPPPLPARLTRTQEADLAAMHLVPGVPCNRCPAADSCPEFKDGYSCAYEETFSGLSSADGRNAILALEAFADAQAARARRALFIESRVAGGQLDANVTRQVEIASQAIERVARLKGAIHDPAPARTTQSVTLTTTTTSTGGTEAPAQPQGLLAALVGAVLQPKPAPQAQAKEVVTVVEVAGDLPISGEPLTVSETKGDAQHDAERKVEGAE